MSLPDVLTLSITWRFEGFRTPIRGRLVAPAAEARTTLLADVDVAFTSRAESAQEIEADKGERSGGGSQRVTRVTLSTLRVTRIRVSWDIRPSASHPMMHLWSLG